MRCHTWPPAASAPHMGVRATMSSPPSLAPGWHILIHERAWALSGQNYPYQNATINTFINPNSESAPFLSLQKKKNNPSPKITNTSLLVLCMCTSLWLPKSIYTFAHNHTPKHRTHKCMFSLMTFYCSYVIRLSVIGRGSSLLLLMGLWAMNSVSPRCW